MRGARPVLVALALLAAGLAPTVASLQTAPADEARGVADGGLGCTEDETRRYDVVARELPISYNAWGDFDPRGRLFLPADDEQAVVQDVAGNLREAGLDTLARWTEDPGVSTLGELGYSARDGAEKAPRLDPFEPSEGVQPLVLRAHVGECVQVTLTNKLPNPTSLHVHGAESPPGQGMAVGENAPDQAAPGETRTYTVRIPDDPAHEGAHMFHSHGDARFQTKHGLFGAVMAEPEGTSWRGMDGSPDPTGPHAMIVDPDGPDYREIGLFYHDEIQLVDRSLDPLPEVSPYGEYGPGSKGINLRSEPFLDRFKAHDRLERGGELDRGHDTSLALSSYTYGDPPVMPESYVGDPTKFRLVNVGPGQAHVHHLHGGGIRWLLSPVGEDTHLDDGLTKYEDGPTHEHPPADDGHAHAGATDAGAGGEARLVAPAGRGDGSVLLDDAEGLAEGDRVAIGEAGARETRRVHGVFGNRVTLTEALREDHAPSTPVRLLSSTGSNPLAEAAAVNANVTEGTYHPHNERTDVQMLSPGEAFNAEVECGAGGCQGSPGDFLFHCHIAEHYMAGMWGFWRTYDTLKPGLAELPDRQGQTPAPVNSTQLVGTTLPNGTTLTEDTLGAWIEDQLPPQGEPRPNGASVWNWTVRDTSEGPLFLGEPETARAWPNYEPEAPGEREPLAFNPDNGRLAFPFLSPHLGKRPPFAPGHGPAPYLGQETAGQAADRLCPASTRELAYDVVATGADVAYNDDGDVDTSGMVFAHAGDADAVQAGETNPPPLVLRANRGDCVNVTLTSQLPRPPGAQRKVNIHTHLVQFDMQATDGSIVGLNYETSVRPADTGARLQAPASAGETVLDLADASSTIREGALVGVGLTDPTMEQARVAAVEGDRVRLAAPLEHDHAPGALVGPEFVNYRWYADVRLGTVYFHDHVDGLETWRHGLFGSLIVEPRDSAWLSPDRPDPDPDASETALNEHVVDVVGPNGTYRELVAVLQDRSATMNGRSLASVDLRAEPFDNREAPVLASGPNGDPATPILEAYPGDDVTVRLLYGGQSTSTGVATFGVTGHRFPIEPESPGSSPRAALSLGISSQHDLQLECGAGGCDELPGDYLYHVTQPGLLEKGAWGIMRVHDQAQPDLQPLPDNEDWTPGEIPDRTDRRFEVVALEANVTFNERTQTTATREVFVPAERADAAASGAANPTPLVLRATAGEVVEVELTNRLDHPVSLHAGMVSANATSGDLGIPVGENEGALVGPGETRTYRWHADRAVGLTHLASYARPAKDPRAGLYGGLVVEPEGATFDEATGPTANVTFPNGTTAREHVLLYASHDPDFQSSVMPYSTSVHGITSVNYRSAPTWNRTGARAPALPTRGEPIGGPGVHTCQVDPDGCTVGAGTLDVEGGARNPVNPLAHHASTGGDPATPVLHAEQGQPVIVRATTGTGDQIQSHTLDGHAWETEPGITGSRVVATETIGQRETSDAWLPAAGPGGAGDYLYGSHRDAFREAGAWGILRVHPADAPGAAAPSPTGGG